MKKCYVGLLAGVLAFGMGAVPLDPLVTDVEAKRFGGGFGRSSFRSGKGGRFKPFSISSSSKARRTGKPKGSIKTGGRKGGIATSGQSVRTKAAINAKRVRDKFKKKPLPVVSGRAGKFSIIKAQRRAAIGEPRKIRFLEVKWSTKANFYCPSTLVQNYAL